jgi:aquaporin Z
MPRKLLAEFFGTGILVFFAVGAAVFGANTMGTLGVALAFGFVLLALAYTFGSVSGCHVNPAVTLGMVVSRRMSPAEGAQYWVAQIAGGIVGAALLKFVVNQNVTDQTGNLGSNGYANDSFPITQTGAFVVEVILTALLVLVILNVTRTEHVPAGFAGLPIGIALGAIHITGIPLTGTSVNPARSFGPALIEGGQAFSQVWLFLLAPLVGALLAVALAPFVSIGSRPPSEDDINVVVVEK